MSDVYLAGEYLRVKQIKYCYLFAARYSEGY